MFISKNVFSEKIHHSQSIIITIIEKDFIKMYSILLFIFYLKNIIVLINIPVV